MRESLKNYADAGVQNIMALGGDIPDDPLARALGVDTPSTSSTWCARAGDFSVGVAAHPDGHPRSAQPGLGPTFPAEKLVSGRLRRHPVLL